MAETNDGERIPAKSCRQIADAIESHLGELDADTLEILQADIPLWRTSGGFRQW